MAVRFGTDGWRAVIADEFTMSNVALVAAAAAALLHERGTAGEGVVVGHDRRFLSDAFARRCAHVLASSGVRVLLCGYPCPTPAVGLAVRSTSSALGIIVTASHNPYQYNGIKLRAATGAPLGPEDRRWIEEWIASARDGIMSRLARPGGEGRIRAHDPWPEYRNHVAARVDLEAIGAAGRTVIHDAMHGAAAGWLERLVPQVRTVRRSRDPLFGGTVPEPLAENLTSLSRRVRRSARPAIGLATDGDGDRLAAIAEDGTYVDSHHLLALLYSHLVEVRGLRGRAVRTVTTSALVDRLAESYGLPVDVTPVGFWHVARRFAAAVRPPAVIGGEESGGIGFPLHLPERDGIFAGLMLLEHLTRQGVTLREAIDRLAQRCGRTYIDRRDVRLPAGEAAAEEAERACLPPRTLLGRPVLRWQRVDGLCIEAAGACRLHVRASHTEPVLRLYAEAGSREDVAALLEEGIALVRAGDRGLRDGVPPVAV
ncbi:MAG: phosphoglucomutase/phosphomannomutase family protein [Bacillota bacterium]|nr:phosphoglucomutase/phosphomannomutase family protein [Bacillota bacterium]